MRLAHHCEGHKSNLFIVRSPFVMGGPVSGADLVLALLICSRSWEKGREVLEGRRSLLRIFLTCLVAAGECVVPNFVFKRAEALSKYMQEADRLPRGIIRETKAQDGKPPEKTHAPSALVFYSDIASHYHISFSEFMNMPCRLATMLRYRLLEIDKLIRWQWWPAKKEKEAANG